MRYYTVISIDTLQNNMVREVNGHVHLQRPSLMVWEQSRRIKSTYVVFNSSIAEAGTSEQLLFLSATNLLG